MTLNIHPVINIPRIGDKIEILDKPEPDDLLPPGTQGYVSEISREVFEENCMAMQLTFQMTRVENHPTYGRYVLNFPVIWDEELQQDEKYFLALPSEIEYYVHFKTEELTDNVMTLSNLEFMAWASARATYIKNRRGETNRVIFWPEDKAHPINRLLKYSKIASEHGPEEVEHHFEENKQIREDIILALRELEAYYFKSICSNTCRYLEVAEFVIERFYKSLRRRKRERVSDRLASIDPMELVGRVNATKNTILAVLGQ